MCAELLDFGKLLQFFFLISIILWNERFQEGVLMHIFIVKRHFHSLTATNQLVVAYIHDLGGLRIMPGIGMQYQVQ